MAAVAVIVVVVFCFSFNNYCTRALTDACHSVLWYRLPFLFLCPPQVHCAFNFSLTPLTPPHHHYSPYASALTCVRVKFYDRLIPFECNASMRSYLPINNSAPHRSPTPSMLRSHAWWWNFAAHLFYDFLQIKEIYIECNVNLARHQRPHWYQSANQPAIQRNSIHFAIHTFRALSPATRWRWQLIRRVH